MFEPTDHELQCRDFIAREMETDCAHDLNHVERVVCTAKALCKEEQAELAVVLPAAWLHDCFSHPKNHPKRSQSTHIAADKAIAFLQSIGYPEKHLDDIHHAIVAHSFSANVAPKTLEAQIVQDADRLDSLGAIGIARTIMVGTTLDTPFYSKDDPFCKTRKPNDHAFMVDHFYTKLFKLQQRFNTASAKREGARRTQYMHVFLAQLAMEI